MKAMIFAAGLGTRLKPLTDTTPKPLLKVNGRPILEFVISRLKQSGVTEIVINVHHLAEQVIDFVNANNSFGIRIEFSDESDLLLDTGGGLKKASWFFDDGKPFILYNGDIISNIDLKRMYDTHINSDAIATLAVRKRETSRYFLFDSSNILCGWRNVRSEEERIERQHSEPLTPLAFSGIHVIHPALFNFFPDEAVFSMVDLYLNIAGKQLIKGYDHSGDEWIDIGKPEALEQATKIIF